MSQYYKAYSVNQFVEQGKSGESGQLTCHAPVTSRSVELDFLVGTENPICLLYGGKLRRQHWMRAAATNKVSPTERTGFVSFSRFFGAMLRN